MSGTFPTNPVPEEIILESNQPVFESISNTGKRQSRIGIGHLWEISVKYTLMQRAEIAPMYAFSMAQSGGAFQITLENYNAPLGIATGTPLVVGVHSAGVKAIQVDGWTAGQTGILKAGSILKFSGHSKVYMLESDADSDGTGLSTLNLNPSIIEDLANNEVVTINNVPFTMFIPEKIIKWKTTHPELSSYTLELTESI